MSTKSRGLLFRLNIKPQTFEIAEINFGNSIGLSTPIQNRPEAMLSEKEKGDEMLFKTPIRK